MLVGLYEGRGGWFGIWCGSAKHRLMHRLLKKAHAKESEHLLAGIALTQSHWLPHYVVVIYLNSQNTAVQKSRRQRQRGVATGPLLGDQVVSKMLGGLPRPMLRYTLHLVAIKRGTFKPPPRHITGQHTH